MSQLAAADPVLELPGSSTTPSEAGKRPDSHASRTTILWWLVLAIVWVVCALYVFHYLRRAWVPHDEGTLGQSAERVLLGQLPHRDFDEVYSGGLSFLNAAAFRALGTNLLSLRLVLYAVFLLWIPAVYYIATRFVAPVAAGAVVLLAAAWSLPNYSAAMPSWYNLFLATFGVAAAIRYIDSGRARWLVVAGICGGLSCIIKIVGVYYIAAVLLFLVYREQDLARGEENEPGSRTWVYSISMSVLLALFVAVVLALISAQMRVREIANFVVPALALVILLMWREWRSPSTADESQRFRALAGMVAPFLLGVALPIILFLVPYLRADAVGALVHGVLVEPMKRLDTAFMHPPRVTQLLLAVALLPLAGIVRIGRQGPSWITRLAVAVLLVAAIAVSDRYARLYIFTWDTMRGSVPLVVVCGAWLVAFRESRLPAVRRQRILLLLAACALCALVQYPFAAPVYFFYVAPLAALAGLAVLASWPGLRKLGPATILAFYLAFAVVRIHPGFINAMAHWYSPYVSETRLALPRGGIDVPAEDAAVYQRLVGLLRQHARGQYTLATPDAPQVYFLSGLANPTRMLYDFFDDPAGHDQRILAALDERRVNALVVNRVPEFSRPISPALASELATLYPHSADVGNFTVRWRE